MSDDEAAGTELTGAHRAVPAGVDLEPVTAWLAERVDALDGPLTVQLMPGGRSNLTFLLTDAAGRRWVLRRPPLKQVLATAHDMGREHKILAALRGSDVPVPPVVGLCTDGSVNGAPFYVMDFIDGLVLRDARAAAELAVPQRAVAGTSLVDTLVRIHAVDVDAVGLGDLGRKEDYLPRQLKRWFTQFERSKLREVPVIDEVHARLVEAMPAQQVATIVHGDYRLDNCIVAPSGEVIAVLDWELCTLGDPMADIGLLLVYTPDPGGIAVTVVPAPSTLEGFPDRTEMLARYAAQSDLDLSGIDYYEAFGFWKLACIVEGVYARYAGGAMGDQDDAGALAFGEQVLILAEQARTVLDAGS